MQLFETFRRLLDAFQKTRLLVDIPMGLPNSYQRDLETQARQKLPGRSSSVFPVPSRDAVYAGSYKDACAINLALSGRKLSVQSWNICAKIREVDELLLENGTLQQRVFESHPELAFCLLNGQPLEYAKKTVAGIEERLALLAQYLPDAASSYDRALSAYRRAQVARDDVVDAMVLAVVGMGPQILMTDTRRKDESGLQIRMVLPGH